MAAIVESPDAAVEGAASQASAACLHCGLAAATGGGYCCYGCELAAEIAAEGQRNEVKLKGALTFCLLLSMSVMMLSLFLFAEDVYPEGGGMLWLRQVYRVASAVLSTPVVALLGLPLLARSAKALSERRFSMDFLVAAGAFAAYALSIAAIVTGKRGIYFDSATSALLLATLGRYLEASARAKASLVLGPSLSLASAPVLAGEDLSALRLVSPAVVEPGMKIRVALEQVVPVDAEVIGEAVEVNLGVLHGTATPVLVHPGERVPAGAVPVSGSLDGIALRSARESTLERLAALAQSLHAKPSKLTRIADTFAAALVPVVSALALGSLVYYAKTDSIERGVMVSLAVVLAACPCTYGVATPLVLWLALRRALESGVCIRTAGAIEELADVETVAFDKTGTLTLAELSVLGVDAADDAGRGEALAIAAALEEGSRHPIATAIQAANAANAAITGARGEAPKINDRRALVGLGVTGRDEQGREVVLGSAKLLASRGVSLLSPGEDDGSVRVGLARSGELIARIRIGEALRPEAALALAELDRQGISAMILTGDSEAGARAVSASLGIEARAGLSPAAKVDELRAHGGRVAMVGDGLNDAPALAGIGPSFAMDGGTGLARGLAKVSLLSPDLRLIPWTLSLARRSVRAARRSLFAATAYNLVFLGLAAAGALRPVWAGLSMLTSSLLTLGASIRASDVPSVTPLDRGANAGDPPSEVRS